MNARVMFRWVLVLLTFAPQLFSQETPPPVAPLLTTVRAIQQLPREQAGQSLPALLRGTVTFSNNRWKLLFIQDATAGIYVECAHQSELPAYGREVEISGITGPGSFMPIIVAQTIRDLGAGRLPAAVPVRGTDLWSGKFDGTRIRLSGLVAEAYMRSNGIPRLVLDLHDGGRPVSVRIFGLKMSQYSDLAFSEVEVEGVFGAEGDGEGKLVAVRVQVPEPSSLKVLRSASNVIAALPMQSIPALLNDPSLKPGALARTRGVVNYAADRDVWLGGDEAGVRIVFAGNQAAKLESGDRLEVAGFIGTNTHVIELVKPTIISRAGGLPLPPVSVSVRELYNWKSSGRVVRVEGEFLHRIPSDPGDLLVFRDGEMTFEAGVRFPMSQADLTRLAAGARFRISGVLRLQPSGIDQQPSPRILIHKPAGIELLTPTPWPMTRTLAVVTGLSIALALGLLALGLVARRRREAVRRLECTEAELKRLNQDLDERIQQRTLQLETANKNLNTDIARRKTVEEKLAASELRYRTLVEGTEVIVWEADPEILDFSYVSPQAARLGFPIGEWLRPGFFREHIHPEDRNWALEFCRSRTARGENHRLQYRFATATGGYVWLDDMATVEIRPDGSRRMRGVMVDITARKTAEARLAASEARFRTLVEGTDVILWEDDPGSPTRKYISPQATRLGYPLEAWQEPGFWVSHLHPEDRAEAAAFGDRETAAGRNHRLQYRFATAKGVYVWIDDTVTIEDRTDGSRVVRGVMLDITERKRTEELQAQLESQLRQSQKMEAIGTLAGGIAHDFNNILGSIIGFTELARLDSKGRPDIKENLDVVIKASHRARALVHQILTFSREQPGVTQLVHLRDVITETVQFLRATTPASLEIQTDIADALPGLAADPTQIQQVFMNLFSNAIHAMRNTAGAKLRVTVRTFEITPEFARRNPALAAGPHLEVRVSDNGCGIAPETLPRIFDPFFTTKPTGEGTGLGLAVAHGIIRTHHGDIRAQSEPGSGTTFVILLPASRTSATGLGPARDITPPPLDAHVIFVDDEEDLRKVGARLLQRAGFQVVAVSSGEEALEQFRSDERAFDMLITDLSMPGMDGLTLITKVRSLRPKLPVILTTGYADRLAAYEARKIGVTEVLLKPNDLDSLSDAVTRALRRAEHSDASSCLEESHP